MLEPDWIGKSFDFASESVKEVIAYSTAVLVLTVTFAGDRLMTARKRIPRALVVAWVLYLVAIAAGIVTLNALVGQLAREAQPSVYGDSVIYPSAVCYAAFLLGLVFTVSAGIAALRKPTQ